MLTHWPKIVAYFGDTRPLQEFQHVVGRVSISVQVLCFAFGYFSFHLVIVVKCCQGQALDSQVTGDDLFESRIELFKVIMQDYRKSFFRSSVVKRDQGFFLCGQMLDFLHRLLRRIVTRYCLPEEGNWDALLDFDFKTVQLLSVSQFNGKNRNSDQGHAGC